MESEICCKDCTWLDCAPVITAPSEILHSAPVERSLTFPDSLYIKLKTNFDLSCNSLCAAIEEEEADAVHSGLVPRH